MYGLPPKLDISVLDKPVNPLANGFCALAGCIVLAAAIPPPYKNEPALAPAVAARPPN